MVVGLLGNKRPDSNRLTLVTPKSGNDVRLQAKLGNQNPVGLLMGVVGGFMVRYDYLRVTSVIRALSLDGNCYETMFHFFRSKAYQLSAIRQRWCEVVRGSGLLYQVDGKTVLIGDGVKQSKEAYHTPEEKELWLLFDRVYVTELLARDEFAKGAYMLEAEDRETMLR